MYDNKDIIWDLNELFPEEVNELWDEFYGSKIYYCLNCGNTITKTNHTLHGDWFCLNPLALPYPYGFNGIPITATEFRKKFIK